MVRNYILFAFLFFCLPIEASYLQNKISGGSGGANQTLSNLTSPVALNQSMLPGATGLTIGNSTTGFDSLYVGTTGSVDGVINFQSTATGTPSIIFPNAIISSVSGATSLADNLLIQTVLGNVHIGSQNGGGQVFIDNQLVVNGYGLIWPNAGIASLGENLGPGTVEGPRKAFITEKVAIGYSYGFSIGSTLSSGNPGIVLSDDNLGALNILWDGTPGNVGDSAYAHSPAGVFSTTSIRTQGSLGVGNAASATIAVGSLSHKIQIFDSTGASLGYIPVYATIN